LKARQCRWCSTEVKPPRRNWCSQACVDEYKDLNDWGWILQKVFKRDAGVCAECGHDTEQLRRILGHAFRREDVHTVSWTRRYISISFVREETERRMGFKPAQSYWECDHILERVRDGTNAMENLQTLCVPCHKRKTARLAADRAIERRESKRIAKEAAEMPLFASLITNQKEELNA
jgi:5-methylcytosine-specific restriction endonuclease McrA